MNNRHNNGKGEDAYAHLLPEEAKILRAQVEITPAAVSIISLYRYTTKFDIIVLVVGYASSIAAGVLLPLMTIIFGQLTQRFTAFFAYGGSRQSFQHDIDHYALYFVYLGIAEIVFVMIGTFVHIDRGEVISGRIREQYLAATLRQNIAYFDKLGAGEITSRITADTDLVREGMSEKVGIILTGIATFVAAFVVGFIKSWKLTLILLSVIIAMICTLAPLSKLMMTASTKSLEGYSVGSSLLEEVFSSVRNIHAFGVQELLAMKYDNHLAITEKFAFRKGAVFAVMIASVWFYVFCSYALGFWQGSRFIASQTVNVGDIITIMMSLLIGAFSLGQIGPNINSVTTGLAAAAKIYAVIDRKSAIDAFSDAGHVLESVRGDIELNDLKFIYPSRPDVTVFEHFNLSIPAGQTVALVGASGSGKSTVVGLLERFYEPVSGTVTLDGHNISKLNTRWLRQQISLVSQEPTLFACSIYENVAYGLIGTEHEHAPQADKLKLITSACEQANAISFINALPDGLDTNVGERGFLMSGGQKQRIAIARAIVSNPKILLLDEATSALDARSEGIVQDALDRAAKSRTTIVIAHRLSTIKDADLIIVMAEGKILEKGKHNELLDKRGAYYDLVKAQRFHKSKSGGDEGVDPIVKEKEQLHGNDLHINDTPLNKEPISTVTAVNDKESLDYGLWGSIKYMYNLNKPERGALLLGVTFSAISGLTYPVQALFFGKCVDAFQVTPEDYAKMRIQINLYAGLFVMLAVVQVIASIGGMGTLAWVAQRLVRRIRFQSFRQMLRQDISFFDKEENTSGSLTSALSRDAQGVEGLSGSTLGQVVNSAVIVISGLIVSIAIAWKLALVCGACMPLLLGCGFLRFYLLATFEKNAKNAYENSASYACEAVSSIRTVVSLTREAEIIEAYHQAVESQVQKDRGSTLRSSFLYSLSQGLSFFTTALGFWYGGTLLRTGEYNSVQFFVTFISVVNGAEAAGGIFSFSPDMSKAKQSAANIRALFDSTPIIDAWKTGGIVPREVDGTIEFRDVYFHYPARPEVEVIQGLNIRAMKGQYVGLVGASGCGKSTVIGLIESFYLPDKGQILLDGQDIKEFNVSAYRQNISLVQQEPVLYAGTIRFNICLGARTEDVSLEQIYEASKKANIHEFIMSLPDGYDTLCGSRGVLLSGGQKQRIAIARALIRDPKILLLDEATSALDSESEQTVQLAIDKAARGRTTIAVAHRLRTIQNADIIYVIEDGKVSESGTHQELLNNKAKYYELVQLQALERD